MKYKSGLLVLILMLLLSLFAPGMLFALQDRIQFTSIRAGQHESWDSKNLVTAYEMSLPLRLNDFAKGLQAQKSYYVTTLEPGSKKDAFDMVVLAEESLLKYLQYEGFELSYNLEQWKRYVVYDKDYENGVAFLLGYIKLSLTDQATMELLLDAQTGTVYYVRVVNGIWEETEKVQNKEAYDVQIYDVLQICYLLADYYEGKFNDSALEQLFAQAGVSLHLKLEYDDGSLDGIFQLTEGDNDCFIVETGLTDIAGFLPQFSTEGDS